MLKKIFGRKPIGPGYRRNYYGLTKERHASYDPNPGDVLRCMPGKIFHPSKFFVIPVAHYQEYKKFQVKLNKFIEKVPKEEDQPIVLGAYVFAYTTRFDTGNAEWQRAKVLEVGQTPDQVKIMLVDYGDELYVKEEEIRSFPCCFAMLFPIIAIECKLIFDDPCYDVMVKVVRGEFNWPKGAGTLLQKVMEKQTLAIRCLWNDTPWGKSDVRCGYRWAVSVKFLKSPTSKLPKNYALWVKEYKPPRKLFQRKSSCLKVDLEDQFLEYFFQLYRA